MTKTNSPLPVGGRKKIRPYAAVKTHPLATAWSDDENNSESSTKATNDPLIDQTDFGLFDPESGLNRVSFPKVKTKRKPSKCLSCGGKSSFPCNVPWVALTNNLVQIFMFVFTNDKIYRLLIYSPYRKREAWRFISYTLLHSDVAHLILNNLLLFFTAFALETEQGYWRVLLLYLSGAVSGALGTSVFQPKLLMIGSSAGVYSLLISHMPHLILNFANLKFKYFRIIALIFLCVSDVGFLTIQILYVKKNSPPISIAAHFSGALNGLLLGFALFFGPKLILFKCLKYLSIVLYLAAFTAAVFITCKCDVSNLELGCL